ncbi:hypothetical protein C1646_661263 [Rhizophagus diaphanus]|nr:hypothetical protein C1646_661263 [Rhizophagus diaphanus] [Rhizophagus sp. MUCL 43196]
MAEWLRRQTRNLMGSARAGQVIYILVILNQFALRDKLYTYFTCLRMKTHTNVNFTITVVKDTGLPNSPEFLCYPEDNRSDQEDKLKQYLKGNISHDGMIVHNSCFYIWYSHMFRL